MSKIRLGIIGCKNMGSKHIRCLQNNFGDEVEIAGILNSTPQSSAAKAQELGVSYFNNIEEITKETVDAVIISTPAENHFESAKLMIEQGMPCLIEKPFAANEEECLILKKLAEKHSIPILVGHTENYNPAVLRLKEELAGRRILSLAGIRTSNNPGVKETHIISELMIHDLAIVNALLGADYEQALISKGAEYRWDEQAVVEMSYPNKSIVRLEAIRADVAIDRRMRIIDDKQNIYKIEFLNRRLSKNGEVLTEDGDSLKNELANFIGVVKGEEMPFVGIDEAISNVHLCNQLENISKRQQNFKKNLATLASQKNHPYISK